jgi:hypothetical protein
MLGGIPPDFVESLGVFLLRGITSPWHGEINLHKLRLVFMFLRHLRKRAIFYADLELGSDAMYRSIERS